MWDKSTGLAQSDIFLSIAIPLGLWLIDFIGKKGIFRTNGSDSAPDMGLCGFAIYFQALITAPMRKIPLEPIFAPGILWLVLFGIFWSTTLLVKRGVKGRLGRFLTIFLGVFNCYMAVNFTINHLLKSGAQ